MNNKLFTRRLSRYYGWYTLGFIAFLMVLAILEHEGMPRVWIGYLFMFVTIALYAGIGVVCRTSDVPEYYVAGRRVPALFNGMATAADWISAATFISLAGGLYLQGFDGLAYIIGWTGGYCLVAVLIAPYLRKFGQYTIADFLAERYSGRYGGTPVRLLAVIATIIISFTYVVAQIYGVGLITSRFTGIDFSIGIFLGLASILVCSFLGGMRAITWTQVAQYIIILLAYLIPVIWLSAKHTSVPVPQVAYGAVLPTLHEIETRLKDDPREKEVRAIFQQRADDFQHKLDGLPQSWENGRQAAQQHINIVRHNSNATLIEIKAANRELSSYPKSVQEAERKWSEARTANLARAAPPLSQTEPFPGKDKEIADIKRNNFLALVFCLMMGTAALPHVLMRYYTTPSVQQTRKSVFWTLFFILLIYITVPALAVLVKYDIYTTLVGSSYAHLPDWVYYWANIDKVNPLVSIADLNHDHIVQLSEISLDGDIIVLATPEIAGLPYFISGLVAAGGLAAALSTADGLLLTISNALSHDVYYKIVDPSASTQKRVTISKLLLLVVALLAAYAASLKPSDILSMVGAAFSLAASTLFPVLVLGVFWRRANQAGAIAGMVIGFIVCVGYMIRTHPAFGGIPDNQWFHITAISAGVFGVPAGTLAIIVASLLTPPPDARTQALIDHIRSPDGKLDSAL
ncbi:sodium:solute symporter family protein [Herbaspirillum sp. RTI4]|uniref:sodium:solute symporter family protein n=1 Tax=Herbaspirillum sp. RTI4 TaxID=3048640 RepID=UPI002AB5B75C|nr:sodium:solute symporter family protein [Herbaspirillum sp. RTI4]MDY7576818.1 sodium:solute symporter family protein [Herbaspirillum sp. RTI4]MEA9981414.1 cation acetate symporter [Herbaspirillum sp. RTI4]